VSRVLLTGADGFIGAPVAARLVGAGHDVHGVCLRGREGEHGLTWHRADLLAPETAEELVGSLRPELLVHLAWYTEHGRFWTSVENVRWVEATLRLLRAFASSGGRRAVLAGTCAEYEWTAQGGVLSEFATPLRPRTLYGAGKDATREVAQALADHAGFELAWGRVFFLYGPCEPETRLVPAVARALLAGLPAEVTDGAQIRDLLHVSDVAAAFQSLLESDVQGAVNIGSGEPVALREVISLVGEAAGRPELIRYGAAQGRPGEPAQLVADVRRLREEVGFRPRVTLEDGIAGTVGWWRERLVAEAAASGR